MTSHKTMEEFYKAFKLNDLVSVKRIMEKLSCSRPTATNAISSLLNRKLTYKNYKKTKRHILYLEPYAIQGDSQKWYKLRKY